MPEGSAGHPRVPFKRHVFVCTSGKKCPDKGSVEICARLKELSKAAGVRRTIRVNKSGCLSQCSHGPMIVVYPEQIWYSGVSLDDVEELFERAVLRGEVVTRLLHGQPSPDPSKDME